MRFILSVLVFIIANNAASQRINKLSIRSENNFYTYGATAGIANKVVRYGDGMALRYKTVDTVKKRGMIYELTANSTLGIYPNALGPNSVLQVEDYHVNANLIFPVLTAYKGLFQHWLGVGLSIGTLAGRDYLNENNQLLDYNNTNLPEEKLGKRWTNGLLIDYEFDISISKRVGFSFGTRFLSSTPIRSKALYEVTRGQAFSFNYGVFFKL